MKQLLSLLLLIPFTATANCTLENISLKTSNIPLANTGDNLWFSGEILAENIQSHCSHLVYLNSLTGASFSANSSSNVIPIKIYDGERIPLPKIGHDFLVKMAINGPTPIWFEAPSAKYAIAGDYAVDIGLRQQPNSPIESLSKLNLSIYPAVELRLDNGVGTQMVKGNNSLKVDLGELRTGKKHNIGINVKSNAHTKVEITAENGTLRNTKNSNDTINYKLELNHIPLPPSNKGAVDIKTISNRGFRRIPLDITIGQADYARAGEYKERILVNVTAY